jgi:hypothetical protein
MRHPAPSLLFLILSALESCSGGGDTAPALPAPIAVQFPIDGVIDFTAFATVRTGSIMLKDKIGQGVVVATTNLRWGMRNDDRHLYIAVEWTDATENRAFDINTGPTDFDGVKLFFDNDGDGTHETGEDERTVIAASVSSQHIDQHVDAGDETDLIGDGRARLLYDAAGQRYQAEFLIPIQDDAKGNDGVKTASTTYNIAVFDNTQLASGSGNVGGLYGAGSNSSAWPAIDLVPAVAHAYPKMPGLTGLFVFVSDHEVAKGEIYTHDPVTGVTTRVTNSPTTFKEGVSLSHDRKRIAYHGSPDRSNFASYEIYVINVDGTGLKQLTTNALLDGHPGWSLGDDEIVYASFRGPQSQAELVVMSSAGVELRTLTPSGRDDNDPDFLADGRIVFKTDRFSTQPQVRIAVMNPDGTNVVQLTKLLGTSDHDPIGDGSVSLFERFNKGTNYATDPETGFTAWDIIEARNDGTSERKILSDGYVNWLPLLDPTRKYIAYLKSSGYTEARLMTRDGKDLGRVIPGMSRLSYLDWK